jgi:hypothetical protein
MDQDRIEPAPSTPSPSRTRRAVLAAAATAVAATAVNAVARPLPVAAAGNDGSPITVGGFLPDAFSQTTLANDNNNENVLWVASNANGGGTGGGIAVTGYSAHSTGVYGFTSDGIGVVGGGDFGRAIVGQSNHSTGVEGASGNGWGMYAHSTSSYGLVASSGTATGAWAVTDAAGDAGVFGWSRGGGMGVYGFSSPTGSPSYPANPLHTGVFGAATGSGTGGHFTSPDGAALKVDGKALFTRAGVTTIPKGKSYVDVSVPGTLTGAGIVATLQRPRSGVYVAAVRPNYPSSGRARIQLNKVASSTSGTKVAWFVFG